MTLQKQVSFWIAAVLVLGIMLYVLADVLLPFVAGLVLAYLLNPLVERLERLGLSRLVATLGILGLFVVLFVMVLVVLAPLIAQQLAAFAARLPDYLRQLQILANERGLPLLERLGLGSGLQDAQASFGEFAKQAVAWGTRVVQSALAGGQAVVSVISLLVITPVVAFYLMIDWNRMIQTVDGWLPVNQRNTIRRLVGDMDGAIAGFIRGQSLVCILLGGFYAVGLSLIGVHSGVLIGLVSGLLSFIPYVGSITGLLLAVGVATVQFWPDWTMPLLAFAIFAVGQFIEGNILQPKLVGGAVGLHPVWLMFAMVAFGSLLGFVGLLLAVPLAAIVGVLARFALEQYLASQLYTGPGAKPPEPGASEVSDA